MSIRGLILLLVLAGALGGLWQYRGALQAKLSSLDMPEVGGAAPASPGAQAGALRKCVKGQQVSYVNTECPPGTQAQAVTGGTVSVVKATPVAPPASASSGPTALHQALDITRDDTLRQKIMERQIEGPR